jgi:glucose-6-phosphate 1-dehydrogenase
MDFSYGSTFGESSGDAYDRLLFDCMLGDQTLFTRADEVEAAWRVVTPALSAWDSPTDPTTIPTYEAGTWQPRSVEELLNCDRRQWRRL